MYDFLNLKLFKVRLLSVAREFSDTGRTEKRLFAAAVDAILSVACLWVAYSLLLNTFFYEFHKVWAYFLILPVVTVICFASLGVYRWVVRSVNSSLQIVLAQGCSIVTAVLMIVMFMAPPDALYTRSAVVIYFLLFIASTIISRYVWKYLMTAATDTVTRIPIGIYGAGAAGQRLATTLSDSGEYSAVCFIDDDVKLAGSRVGGLPVVSSSKSGLLELINSKNINFIVLALPSMSSEQCNKIARELNDIGILVKTVPSIVELVSGRATLADIRDVAIVDILGRTEIKANTNLLSKCVTGKNILVTGGGGSIGSEICRQIIQLDPNQLVVLEQSEENLYHIIEEIEKSLSQKQMDIVFVPILGSVLDLDKVESIFSRFSINTVYHAAAYKHVPIIEHAPEEGVRVNIFGTKLVLEASIKYKVDTFLLVSTDKAVRPTNVMGATKRFAEMVLQAKAVKSKDTKIGMVRFGNVLGSSGSVIPKFRAQIKNGGPVTVTDPNMTRYFMTIPEASQLVLQASSLVKGGEVFVLDMGESVRIQDLAKNMIDLMGMQSIDEKKPNYIAIEFSGIRPGEKLYEELFITNDHRKTAIPKIFVDKESFLFWSHLEPALDELFRFSKGSSAIELRQMLFEIIEMTSQAEVVSPILCQNQK